MAQPTSSHALETIERTGILPTALTSPQHLGSVTSRLQGRRQSTNTKEPKQGNEDPTRTSEPVENKPHKVVVGEHAVAFAGDASEGQKHRWPRKPPGEPHYYLTSVFSRKLHRSAADPSDSPSSLTPTRTPEPRGRSNRRRKRKSLWIRRENCSKGKELRRRSRPSL